MGRVKLAIKKIGSSSGCQSTYGKRKNGLFKKASELSILCDIDIVLLMFSPTGRPTLYTRESRYILFLLIVLDRAFAFIFIAFTVGL